MTAIEIVLLVLFAASEIHHRLEKRGLIDRINAKNYPEYRYYKDKWPADLKAVDQLRKDARKDAEAEVADETATEEALKKKKIMSLANFEEFAAEEDEG